MTKITLDRAYAARKPGDEIEVSELEMDALVAIGIIRRPEPMAADEPVAKEEELAPMISLNSAPAPQPAVVAVPENANTHEEEEAAK